MSEHNHHNTLKAIFPVQGMSCAACAISVESILKAVPGVISANVNFAGTSASVEFDPDETGPEAMRKQVQKIGYDIIIEQISQDDLDSLKRTEYNKLKSKTIWAFVLSLPVVIIAMLIHDKVPYADYIMMALSAPVVFWFGRSFFINGFKQARHLSANMDTLVALSTGIAFLFSAFNTFFPHIMMINGMMAQVYYESAAVVVTFILLGKLLEEQAKSNASSAIKKLMGLQPKTVTVVKDGQEIITPIEQVEKGAFILIRPGEKIPVDGIVSEGHSFIDESMISGEPIAVEKIVGKEVFAGTINQKGSLHIQAAKVGAETLLSQIIEAVKQAQGSKAPIQKLADRIAGVFVPIVISIALLSFGLWFFLGGDHHISQAVLAAVTVLIIACPCALGLATPTAIMVGVGKGAQYGILIKDAESLEKAHLLKAIVLDKTGTITKGQPEVSQMEWMPAQEKYSDILHSMESKSEHPLAGSIVQYLGDQHKPVSLDGFESIIGKGIKAIFEGEHYYAGTAKLLEENGVSISKSITAKNEGATLVYFSNSKELLAVIAIADAIKPESAEAIKQLHEEGIEVYMLTGDNEEAARMIAEKAGITHYKANVLPADKAAFIKELQKGGKVVGMAGDGINDSEALALADVSIAMGKGTDIAMDVAKITLVNSNLQSIPKAIRLSRATMRTIRQNLFWAFIYNIIGIPIAAGVLYPFTGYMLDPMIAGAAMALSSVSVVSNSLRLRSTKL